MSKGEIKMMKRLSLITVGFMLILFVTGAHAAYLVDTGEDALATKPVLASTQWLAGEFVLDNRSTITDIEGWMQERPGAVTIAISNGATTTQGGEIPGSEIYSQSFELGDISYHMEWHGISSLSWILDPGTYWVSFEIREGRTYSGLMKKAANPLSNNAYYSNEAWVPYDGTDLAVKIQGNVSGVPIPGAIWLLGSGLFGLVGFRRKFKKS
jgi:hypothetical protein